VSSRRVLVTGGSGFIGAALARRLLHDGCSVRVLDDNSRGAPRRLADIADAVDMRIGDIRDAKAVAEAVRGVDEVHHLAFVNGTGLFYSHPELVLDVGVKGIVNVIDACRQHGVGTLVLASSSEVYQTPPRIPTDETVPLIVPDPHNPRFSYGGGKIISELMAINFGRKYFERVLIFRPHNIYGPDMGWEHVIPQFALRLHRAIGRFPSGPLPFPLQGNGAETRSFCHISDLVEGVMVMRAHGAHLGIYHIGTAEEVTIAGLAAAMAACLGREVEINPGPAAEGGTRRRRPDISKLAALGYRPRVALATGLPPTVRWYLEHAHMAPNA
jgi:nucleoside-diphosphate-sugar epimerase